MNDAIECAGCGACCQHVATPPGLYPIFASARWDGAYLADSDDARLWAVMPAALQSELRALYAERRNDVGPCVWLDPDGRCRHYEHRPEACRAAVVPGDEHCHAARVELVQVNTSRLSKNNSEK